MIISLAGKWNFKRADEEKSFESVVPGCNYLDLMKNGVIADPFAGTNEKACYFVAEKDWIYFRKFNIDNEILSCDEIILVAKMLDTVCDVYINGALVKRCENCFTEHCIDIKENIKQGENEIRIDFISPVNYVKEKCKGVAVPPNANGQNGVAFIRKPAYHFGWDWGPVLPPSGITGDIYIEGKKSAKITNLKISQKHNEDASVEVAVLCESEKLCECETKIAVTLIHPDGKEEIIEADSAKFLIEKPELWWTYELSGKNTQPLYTIKAELFANGEVVDSKKKTIGLRTIELCREKDEYGHNFCFKLNGVAIFAKGADYIPGDSFISRQTKAELEKLAKAMRFSNFNMLRVWGGGYYAPDELLTLCDEMGILVWQDFQFACMPYPFFNKEFLQNVRSEVEYNIKRIKDHPCLALWCGNNEIETMAGGWMHLREYISATKEFFYGILKEWVAELDGITPFISGSPCGIDYGKETDSDNSGDTHIWSVWHGLADMNIYRKRFTRFCSEFGFESLPDMKTIESFAEEKDYLLDSKVFLSHQKCFTGNEKIIYYVNSYFGMPKNFKDFIYLSQITQALCIQNAVEHWRRNKGRCNGALYWQFNDCWPTCSWSSYDYYGNYKALQYFAKHFNAPVTVSLEDTKDTLKAVLINDLNESSEATVKCSVFDFEKGILCEKQRDVTLKANSKMTVYNISLKGMLEKFDSKKTGICVSVIRDGVEIARKVHLLLKERELCLPKAKLTVKKSTDEDKITLTVQCDKFARFVNVKSSVSTMPFSDNYFDLLPGESRTVTVEIDKTIDTEKQLSAIETLSLNNIEMRKMTLKEIKAQLKMFMSPITIGNMVWHSRKV